MEDVFADTSVIMRLSSPLIGNLFGDVGTACVPVEAGGIAHPH